RIALTLTAVVVVPLARADEPKKGDFAHDVVPLLKARCAECHTNGKYKGGFTLDNREDLLKTKAVTPRKSADSELVKRITHTDQMKRMPSKGPALTEKEVAVLRGWIDQGLAWEPGFTFKTSTYAAALKPRRPELPPARGGRDHPIDRIIDAYQAAHKVEAPPPPLDDRAFARRAYLDLIGLLPGPEEVEAFVADTAADKHEKLMRKLLDDKRCYTEHWLTFWNDLLRND